LDAQKAGELGRSVAYAEKFDRLNEDEKEKAIMHELLHIPKSMGRGYRHHDYVTRRRVEALWRRCRNE